ncbi:DUF1120 domain-containing protein [Serratia quinivorans]|uniref:DUF1120 domain-containing protein n=1 Tax=Serratia quinivorans TaxID=137545 RepID=UPI002176F16D|nr:DUF1120 domain-containing protein [Serratia quinivorans]CAI1827601.1 Protein of uncharacterised function (DUF1120) [Serratia quinivorans]CAI1945473.1 Protein of uncharacterised function (DUF1120) [Serratia quinivorans]
MKKTLLATLLAAGAVFCASSAFAADSVDLKVIGTITPVACIPTLSGGGTVDYGTIKADTLKVDDYTVLPLKTLDFSITCDGRTKVALQATNGRIGSLAGVTEGVTGAAATPVAFPDLSGSNGAVGLGLDGVAKIGGYGLVINPTSITADGIAVDAIQWSDSGSTAWTKTTVGSIYNNTLGRRLSWAATGTLIPVTFKIMAAKLDVQAYINKTSELDITKPIKLDGLTTLELVYL